MCDQIHIETARAAMARASWRRGQSPRYDEDAVSDLLADIRHFCAVASHDFDRCSHVAAMYFQDENGGAS